MKTFRQMVDEFRARGRRYVSPRPMRQIADRLGISRTHLYNLMDGHKGASDWTLRRIARAFGTSVDEVRDALKKTRKENAS